MDELVLNLMRQAHERYNTALTNAREIVADARRCGCKECLSTLKNLESITIPLIEGQMKATEALFVQLRAV